jgi:uncharacterized protein
MLLPDAAPVGAPIWCDLMTSDPERSRAFYGGLFGWGHIDPGSDFGGYFNFTSNDKMVGGGMINQPESGMPDMWSVYLKSNDIKATEAATAAHGGTVLFPAMDVMDLGKMLVTMDPSGAGIGAWQQGTHRGFQALTEPGAPCWFELATREYDKAIQFYQDVHHWETEMVMDTPEMRYTTVKDGTGSDWCAGVGDASTWLPEGVPNHWVVYFGSDDVDASLEKVVKLGGTVTQPAEDTPYGRMAAALDSTGAAFKIMKGNA